jgi:phospholipid N-methyltransferase
MHQVKPVISPLQGHWSFFQQFLRHPLQLGSIVPSSRYLEQRIVAQAGADSAGVIVELGPGSGGTTRALLTAMAPDARLLSIELNRDLHALVSHIGDARLIAHRGDARDLCETMGQYNLAAPDAVVSGIPFSTMDPGTGRAILTAIAAVLPAGGRFVAYQLSSRVAELARPILGEPVVELEPLNIPPMRVYCWTRGTGSRPAAG